MSELLRRARACERLDDLDIVDIHAHLEGYSHAIPDSSAAVVVASMDRIGISQTVCTAMPSQTADMADVNDGIAAQMRTQPGRILAYAYLFPHSAGAVEAELTRRLDEGFIGVKLHNANGFPYTDEAYVPAWKIADERRLPVLLHTGGDEQTFTEVAALAGTYPGAVLLLAHSGCRNEDEYIRVAREHPNIMLETAFSQSSRGLVSRLVAGVGAERVIWGSDVVFINQAQQLGKVLGAAVSDDDKRQILSGNARRILGSIAK